MMADEYIERDAAINEQKRFRGYLDDDMLNRLEIATRRIPAADVRPVVTCGECIHRHDPRRQSCIGRRPDFFCADGEKRGES